MKRRIYQRMREALSVEKPDKEFAYLLASEKNESHSKRRSRIAGRLVTGFKNIPERALHPVLIQLSLLSSF
jgi:hypothetical protein